MCSSEDSKIDRPRSRRRWRILGILCIEVVVVLALLEVGLRVSHAHSPGLRRMLFMTGVRTRYEHASDLRELMEMTASGFIPRTLHGDFVLNSNGLKTTEYEVAKPEGTFRVVVLGDSFTFSSAGVPYDTLWHVQLQRILAETTTMPVEVISLGVRAVGPDFYRRMWEVEGARLGADLVVVGFFIGNDFRDAIPVVPLAQAQGFDALARRSYVARLARNVYRDRTGRAVQAKEKDLGRVFDTGGIRLPQYSDRYDPARPTLKPAPFEKIHKGRFRLFADTYREDLDEGLAVTAPYLLGLRDQVLASGASLAVMLIPGETQVNPELEATVAAAMGLEAGDYDVSIPDQVISDWLAEQEIPYLDLLPEFQDAARDRSLYKKLDTHWNIEGNTLAAELLAEFLRADGLVD